ncbi:MAG: Gfo/Idh/MocA family oxidoreductase [Lentisphaeria bacterium]
MKKVGVIGCGNISSAYFKASKTFEQIFQITKVTDLDKEKANAQAATFGYQIAANAKELLKDPEIDIVLNLTTPLLHTKINTMILESGKISHSEKPFGLNREDAKKVLTLAQSKKLITGSAPDTFLGGGQQTCRKLIDDGKIGTVVSGTAFMMCHGHESWHPAPGFYYQQGGGPLLDMGPYYITTLVNMLGPVEEVCAFTSRAMNQRCCSAPSTAGQILDVGVDTHIAGTLKFVSGAIITLVTSFDVWKHTIPPIELHGTEGSLRVPDPNNFGGEVKIFQPWLADWAPVKLTHGYTDNMRSIGLADLARSLSSSTPARCSGKLAYHVLDVMLSLLDSGKKHKFIKIESTCDRPAALPTNLKQGQLGD